MRPARTCWLLALLSMGALQGCAYLHSPAKEALGKDAKDAWGKVDLQAPIAVARANYESIHTRQLANLDELKSVTRDGLLLQVSLAYSRTVEEEILSLQTSMEVNATTMPCKVDAAFGFCVMDREGFVAPYKKAKQAVEDAQDQWSAKRNTVRLKVDTPLPTCDAWMAPDGKAKKPWLALTTTDEVVLSALGKDAQNLTQNCLDITTAQASLKKLLETSAPKAASGTSPSAALYATATIPSQMAVVATLQGEVTKLKAQAAEAAAAVEKAKTAGDESDAEAAKDPESKTAVEKLHDAAAKFNDASSKVVSASTQFPNNPFLKDLALTLKSESLTAYFKTLKDTKADEAPPANSGKAAAVTILFANYFDTTTNRFKATEGYGLATLALEEQLIALEQQRTKREISVLEQRLALAQQKLAVLEQALEGYVTADGYLAEFLQQYPKTNLHDALTGKPTFKQSCANTVSKADPCFKKTEILVPVSKDARTSLWLGIGTYIQTGVMYPSQFRQLTESEFALSRADRMAASEQNLQVWNAVLTSNVNQLETWASFGITKDDFQKAINNVLTGLIAVGVLK